MANFFLNQNTRKGSKLIFFHLTEAAGGAEKITEALLEHWPYPEVSLVTNNKRCFEKRKARVFDFPGPAFFPNNLSALISQLYTLRNLLKEIRPTVLVGVMHYSAFLAALAIRLLPPWRRPQMIAALHGPIKPALETVLRSQKRKLLWAAKLLCLLTERFIVPSSGMKKELVEEFNIEESSCWIIPNGIDLKIINAARRPVAPSPWPPGSIPLLWLGRLAPEKHPEAIFPALRSLYQLPWHFCLAGDGPLKSIIERQLAHYGLTAKVRLLGYRKDVYALLWQTEILIHTCLFEGFGLSILEALACGCAVLAEDCPYGPREILAKGKYGLLFKDTDDFKKKLRALLTDDEYRCLLSKKALERAKEYPLERTLKGYLEVILG